MPVPLGVHAGQVAPAGHRKVEWRSTRIPRRSLGPFSSAHAQSDAASASGTGHRVRASEAAIGGSPSARLPTVNQPRILFDEGAWQHARLTA